MITDRTELRRVLTGKGIKPTCQRMASLESVSADAGHPTIRALHERLVRRIPTLSKTTLYSTLELFARKGLVAPLLIDPSEARFDGVVAPHHHFCCTACGRILDIELSCPNSRRGEIHGHRIDEVHGYFKGVCADCLAALSLRPRQNSHKRRSPVHA
jgi:Fe2+ or Zn2+ uptake regulation protein